MTKVVARSIILTATAAMATGTQLFEGAHLTGGNTRYCCESSKCRNNALFVGQIIKYALRMILGFGSNGPPSNKKFLLKCAPSNFWDLNQINLIYALFSRIQLVTITRF